MVRLERGIALAGVLAVAACAGGPRFEPRLAQVRDVPVLAGLGPADSLARARTYLGARQYGLAIELFKAAKQDPALAADSLNGLAIAYDGIGRRDLAERYFQEALAARPGDDRTRRNLASFYDASGQAEKRRALLASAVVPEVSVPSLAVAAEAPLAQGAPPSAAPAIEIASLNLDARSPLAPMMQPLLVKASLTVPVAVQPGMGLADVTIVCDEAESLSAEPAAAPMKIFRVSVGEVFITAEPSGSSCRVDEPVHLAPAAPAAPLMSNKEYLGLVAAHLDQINRSLPRRELALLWRAAFWADDAA